MIPVTPIEGRAVLLNANLIGAIEETPDTVIVFAGGQRSCSWSRRQWTGCSTLSKRHSEPRCWGCRTNASPAATTRRHNVVMMGRRRLV